MALLASLVLAAPAVAQEALRKEVALSDGATLRALDTITGRLDDLVLLVGETQGFGRLEITLRECRYPVDNPASDAFAYLEINDTREDGLQFQGWMTAASPSLSAMDHQRYDVWVIRCNIPAAASEENTDG